MFRSRLDAFFGRGLAAVTVPSMDGALRPNSILDEARVICGVQAPDNLTAVGADLLFSSGNGVYVAEGGSDGPREKLRMPDTIASLAWSAGTLAVGLAGAVHLVGGEWDGRRLTEFKGVPVRCPTAMGFERPGVLIVCLGSQTNPPDEWKRDLLQGEVSGSVWRIDLGANSFECVAKSLAYPCGVTARSNGETLDLGGLGAQGVAHPTQFAYRPAYRAPASISVAIFGCCRWRGLAHVLRAASPDGGTRLEREGLSRAYDGGG